MANPGKLEESLRLQRVFDFLSDMREHSTREIQDKAHIASAGSTCNDLRQNLERTDLPSKYRGYRLPKAKYKGRTEGGGKIYLYRLERVETEPVQESFLTAGFTGKTAVLK